MVQMCVEWGILHKIYSKKIRVRKIFRGKRSLNNIFKIIFSLRPNLYWHTGANGSSLVLNVVFWLSRSVGNGRLGWMAGSDNYTYNLCLLPPPPHPAHTQNSHMFTRAEGNMQKSSPQGSQGTGDLFVSSQPRTNNFTNNYQIFIFFSYFYCSHL